jgi:hypothetical protein
VFNNLPVNKNQSTQFRPREMNQPKYQQQQMSGLLPAAYIDNGSE